MDCSACARIARIADGGNPDFVVTLAESHVTLADEQAYRGYCILLLKDHHEQLDEHEGEREPAGGQREPDDEAAHARRQRPIARRSSPTSRSRSAPGSVTRRSESGRFQIGFIGSGSSAWRGITCQWTCVTKLPRHA